MTAAIPRSPCGRSIGVAIPRKTGMSGRPMRSKTRSVFSVVSSTPVLPLTAVAPTSSMSGDSAATISATASSVPVSTSRMTFVGMTAVYGERWHGRLTREQPVLLGARRGWAREKLEHRR